MQIQQPHIRSVPITSFSYTGNELRLFADAINWKAYWANEISAYIGESILDVGAGIGATVTTFRSSLFKSWVCLEPDKEFCAEIQKKIKTGYLPNTVEARDITTNQLDPMERFDTVLYIDVLEHIEDDKAELKRVSRHLTEDGHVIIVAPSHNFLYSAFDAKIGHHRRYNKTMLQAITPPDLTIRRMSYLDSVGLFASLANKLILRSADPAYSQIQFWDRFMVTSSRVVDPFLRYRLGKSIVCIFQKTAHPRQRMS